MQLQQGTLLQGGKFRIDRVLGQGGFGITYLGMQVGLNRRVAIKEFFMKEHCNRDESTSHVSVGSVGSRDMVERFKQKFLKEAQTIASFDHQHIVRIHDIFEENGTAYYVMECLEGGSMSDLLLHNKFNDETALKFIRQIASALDYIHHQNILHLDIKPSNILLRRNGDAVLIDFGISKRYDESGSQTSSTPAGISQGYAPIEQYNQGLQQFSPATDIYSLGATLYKMLTGATPPDASVVYEDGLPERPDYVSPQMWKVITAAMQPRRKDRPQNISAFLALLPEVAPDAETVVPHRVAEIKAETTEVPEPKEEETVVNQPIQATPKPQPAVSASKPAVAAAPKTETANSGKNNLKIVGIAGAAIAALLAVSLVAFYIWGSGNDKKTDNVVVVTDSLMGYGEADSAAVIPEQSVNVAASPVQDEALNRHQEEANAKKEAEEKAKKEAAERAEREAIAAADAAAVKLMQDAEEKAKQEAVEKARREAETNEVIDAPDEMPEYPGGQAQLMNFLQSNIHYPAVAVENNIQGRVIVEFVVEKDGSISNVKVIKSVDSSLDKEALRVINSMQKWSPGKKNGKVVRVKNIVPVTFQL